MNSNTAERALYRHVDTMQDYEGYKFEDDKYIYFAESAARRILKNDPEVRQFAFSKDHDIAFTRLYIGYTGDNPNVKFSDVCYARQVVIGERIITVYPVFNPEIWTESPLNPVYVVSNGLPGYMPNSIAYFRFSSDARDYFKTLSAELKEDESNESVWLDKHTLGYCGLSSYADMERANEA